MTTKSEPTFYARIYIAGDIATIKQVCRKYCFDVGLCVTVTPTDFIYTGGEESGAVVGLLNYPRFPSEQEVILAKATNLANEIMEACHQWSWLIETPTDTIFHSRREER